MRKLLVLLSLACVAASLALGVSLVGPATPSAEAASSGHLLKYQTAKRYATRAASNRARHDKRITGWELVRAYRLDRHKFVFAWYAQLADGRGCTAQLVTRYASLKSNKVVAYFRMEECS
jgi:hypothetical protein